MAASYAWHPGTGRVNSRWPVPVRMQPDELFSTWLVRAALAQGCDPLILTGNLWPKWRIWTVDSDRGVTLDRLIVLARVSGIDVDALKASSLKEIALAVKTSPANAAVLPWILALGARNRQRHGGLQYCAECFREDKSPFFRLQWRLAWHTSCEVHNVRLFDRCCHCFTPVEPHRLSAMQCIISICPSCGQDLRKCMARQGNADALAFQKSADVAIKCGHGLYGESTIPTTEWFALSKYFLLLVRTASRRQSTNFANCLTTLGANIAATQPSITGLSFELLPVGEREEFLAVTQNILSAGPIRLLDAAHGNLLNSTMLRQGLQELPPSILNIVDSLPKQGRSPRLNYEIRIGRPTSPATVTHMWARLQRKMRQSS